MNVWHKQMKDVIQLKKIGRRVAYTFTLTYTIHIYGLCDCVWNRQTYREQSTCHAGGGDRGSLGSVWLSVVLDEAELLLQQLFESDEPELTTSEQVRKCIGDGITPNSLNTIMIGFGVVVVIVIVIFVCHLFYFYFYFWM